MRVASAGLRPIPAGAYSFVESVVQGAPDFPGVYLLYDGLELVYIGKASVSIRTRLQSHLRGGEQPGTARASSYMWELCSNPGFREAQLIQAYRQCFGRMPRENDLQPGASLLAAAAAGLYRR